MVQQVDSNHDPKGPEAISYWIKTQNGQKYHRNKELKPVDYMQKNPIARPFIAKLFTTRLSWSTGQKPNPTTLAWLTKAINKPSHRSTSGLLQSSNNFLPTA